MLYLAHITAQSIDRATNMAKMLKDNVVDICHGLT
jgi:hypothetical protein